ncbi:MAG: M48 family metalloprotease [Planctomycetia bacterium]|nr:M48 family metalloprotease [Planctomycetia bacterium]
MNDEFITWKDWTASERMLKFREKHPIKYGIYLLWLVVQSLIAMVFVIAAALFLVYYAPIAGVVLVIIPSVFCYWIVITHGPWDDTLYLERKKFPEVYKKVDEIAKKIKSRKIHAIYIDNNFNACAVSRFSMTPFRRNYLILGYPLLCALSERGLSGCLAHEMGHISYHHSFISGIFYRLLLFWQTPALGLLIFIVIIWLKCWMRTFIFAVLPIFRQHEIDADTFCVEHLGGASIAACVVEMATKTPIFLKYNTDMLLEMQSESWENYDLARNMQKALKENPTDEKLERIINKKIRQIPNVLDEHPSFAERLKIAGCVSPWSYVRHDANALESFFTLDDEFYDMINQYYHQLLEEHAEEVKNQAETYQKYLAENPPSPNMRISKIHSAIVALAFFNPEASKKFLAECLEKMPDHPELLMMHAGDLYEKEPERAKEIFESCLEKSPYLYLQNNTNVLLQYYIDTGDRNGLQRFLEMRDKKVPNLIKTFNGKLKAGDRLIPVEKDENVVLELCRCLSKYAPIKRAYLVSRIYDEQISLHTDFCVLVENTTSFSFVLKHKNAFLEELNRIFSNAGIVFIYKRQSFCDTHLASIPGALFYDKKEYKKGKR